jgi:hypothetical protein
MPVTAELANDSLSDDRLVNYEAKNKNLSNQIPDADPEVRQGPHLIDAGVGV